MTQRILILSHDNKIGDAIVATGLFKPLRDQMPECEIGVLCGPNNAEIYRYHPDVKWVHVSASRNVFARIWASLKARFRRYDIVVHFGLDLANPSQQIVLKMVNAKQRFLFAVHPISPLPTDVIMDGALNDEHHSARHMRFLQTLNAAPDLYRYDIRLKDPFFKLSSENDRQLMVINCQSSAANKSLSIAWLEEFVNAVYLQHINFSIQLLSASHDLEATLREAFDTLQDRVFVSPFVPTIQSSLAIIQTADLVVTPDTYAVHAASAWNKPVIALYEPSILSVDSWEPLSDAYVQIVAPHGKTVSDISILEVMNALSHILANPKSQKRIFLKKTNDQNPVVESHAYTYR